METFSALDSIGSVVHGFVGRVQGIDARGDKHAALAALADAHSSARETLGVGNRHWITCEQVHGCSVVTIVHPPKTPALCCPDADALVTNHPRLALGIYVADCCAVYLAAPSKGVIGLAHSGKKGTELGIVSKTIQAMCSLSRCSPGDIVAQLSPCIRPPHYEIDFAHEIVLQCRKEGVLNVFDSSVCTATHPEKYYSYRREQGRTGRMLAILALS